MGNAPVSSNAWHAVDGFAYDVHDPSANLCAHRHGDGFSGRDHFHAALQTVRTVHGDGAHRIFSDVLLHFHDQCLAARTLDFQSVVYARKVCVLFLSRCARNERLPPGR